MAWNMPYAFSLSYPERESASSSTPIYYKLGGSEFVLYCLEGSTHGT